MCRLTNHRQLITEELTDINYAISGFSIELDRKAFVMNVFRLYHRVRHESSICVLFLLFQLHLQITVGLYGNHVKLLSHRERKREREKCR